MKHFFFAILLMLFCNLSAQTPVQDNGALSVNGNKIVNANGDPVSFAGCSLFWSNNGWGGERYYNASVVRKIKNDWNATIVRAAMGVEDNGGYLSDNTNKQKIITVVDAAIAEGMYVIIDWHSHHAEDYQTEAIEFFEDMATRYKNAPNVIYEIYNEPLNNVSWTNTIKPYAEAVIAAIRAIDSDNLIIVGTPRWSQNVDVASNNPITGYSNIAYTLHFYAGTHRQSIRDRAQTALNNGVALMVTEWGTVNANGDGAVNTAETEKWMDFLCENNISHCNWALNDKVEGASALVSGASTSGNWDDNDYTTSGEFVKGIVEEWDTNCSASALSIEDTGETNLFEVFPNPTNALLNIKTKQGAQLLSISLVNAIGSKILQIESPKRQLNLSTLTNGIYFMRIESSLGSTTKKIIIN
jgi:aryl-phospho-beta-D-glucosidase BglC (GH1 family)